MNERHRVRLPHGQQFRREAMGHNEVVFGRLAHAATTCEEIARRNDMAGVRHMDLHLVRGKAQCSDDQLRSVAELCRQRDYTFALNIEGMPVDWTPSPALLADVVAGGRCRGVVFDECDWLQINAHWKLVADWGARGSGNHFFANTEGMTLDGAYQAVLRRAAERARPYLDAGVPAVASEHLYPVMMHTMARAGLAISPKVLKETWGPAMLACALGAALQYGRDLWVCVDEWWHPQAHGHPMGRYRSALRLAYWMGASTIYTEGGNLYGLGYGDQFTLSEQGEILKQTARQYVLEHPRPYTHRDVRPNVAIIRFDDTCFDIRQHTLGEYPGPLYGHIPATPENAEWLTIWNFLSHGYARTDSLSHNWETKLPIARSLFMPLSNVVVYDHRVTDALLEGIDWLFLSGHTIPAETFEAVGRRVRAGATCLLPTRMLPAAAQARNWDDVTVLPEGAGRWVCPKAWYSLHYEPFTNGPCDRTLREVIEGALGPDDCLQYAFGDRQLKVRMVGGDPDHLEYALL
jgi:hypothetical protein